MTSWTRDQKGKNFIYYDLYTVRKLCTRTTLSGNFQEHNQGFKMEDEAEIIP